MKFRKKPMKIYQVCEDEWVAAGSAKQARDWYVRSTGIDDDEIFDPSETISEEDMDRLKIYTEDEFFKPAEQRVGQTFRQCLSEAMADPKQLFPFLFCSNEL